MEVAVLVYYSGLLVSFGYVLLLLWKTGQQQFADFWESGSTYYLVDG